MGPVGRARRRLVLIGLSVLAASVVAFLAAVAAAQDYIPDSINCKKAQNPCAAEKFCLRPNCLDYFERAEGGRWNFYHSTSVTNPFLYIETNGTVTSATPIYSLNHIYAPLNLSDQIYSATAAGTPMLYSYVNNGVYVDWGLGAGDQISSDGTDLIADTRIKINGGGTSLGSYYRLAQTHDFAAVLANTCGDSSTFTLTGAQAGAPCFLGVEDGAMATGYNFVCWVSAANTVRVRACCHNGATDCIDLGSYTYQISVFNP